MSCCHKIAIAFFILSILYILVVLKQKKDIKSQKESFTLDDELLFFYADWCAHCTRFKPEVANFEQTGMIKITYLNDKTTKSVIKNEYNIEGYPTIYYVNHTNNKKIPFGGPRTMEGLQNFVKECRSSR